VTLFLERISCLIQHKKTAFKLMRAYLEGRVSLYRRPPGIDRLQKPIKQVFL